MAVLPPGTEVEEVLPAAAGASVATTVSDGAGPSSTPSAGAGAGRGGSSKGKGKERGKDKGKGKAAAVLQIAADDDLFDDVRASAAPPSPLAHVLCPLPLSLSAETAQLSGGTAHSGQLAGGWWRRSGTVSSALECSRPLTVYRALSAAFSGTAAPARSNAGSSRARCRPQRQASSRTWQPRCGDALLSSVSHLIRASDALCHAHLSQWGHKSLADDQCWTRLWPGVMAGAKTSCSHIHKSHNKLPRHYLSCAVEWQSYRNCVE